MKYIILLRGINISGKNKISMSELKIELEKNSYQNVKTYLNSGNIIVDTFLEKKETVNNIQRIIKNKFQLDIPVYVITVEELKEIVKHSPKWWGTDNKELYDNIIFIMPPKTVDDVMNSIGEPSNNIDQIEKYKNILFWTYDLNHYQKSNWWKKTATESIKDFITIRTANTMKKVLELCES